MVGMRNIHLAEQIHAGAGTGKCVCTFVSYVEVKGRHSVFSSSFSSLLSEGESPTEHRTILFW